MRHRVSATLQAKGCGCLFEGILDGAFVVIVLAGIGWVVSNNHGA